jgi:adenosylcobinamide-phosphate synthase
MSESAWLLAVAFGLDLALGDPRWLPHPVRGFGRLVLWLERLWRRNASVAALRVRGVFFALSALLCAATVVWLSLRWTSGWLASVVTVYWAYSLLAVRSLDGESWAVVEQLQENNLAGVNPFTVVGPLSAFSRKLAATNSPAVPAACVSGSGW